MKIMDDLHMDKENSMKKLLSLTAVVLAFMPAGLQAQEPMEAPNLDAPAPAKAEAKDAKANAKDAKANASKSQFAAQQQKIQVQMNNMKKAKKTSEKRKIRDVLLREQRNLEIQVNRKLQPLQMKVAPLKERIRLSRKSYRPALEKELADLEAQIETIKKDADLEKWCAKPKGNAPEAGSAPDPGPSRKIRRGKKKK